MFGVRAGVRILSGSGNAITTNTLSVTPTHWRESESTSRRTLRDGIWIVKIPTAQETMSLTCGWTAFRINRKGKTNAHEDAVFPFMRRQGRRTMATSTGAKTVHGRDGGRATRSHPAGHRACRMCCETRPYMAANISWAACNGASDSVNYGSRFRRTYAFGD